MEASIQEESSGFSGSDVYVMPNETAYFSIQGVPGVTYYITVVTPRGNISQAQGLDPQVAGTDGVVYWSWKVGSKTQPGVGSITVSDGLESKSYNYNVG